MNKGEQRHALAQAVCTFKQGRIADRGSEAQQYRASGLNLIIAAIVYWNSTYLADAVAHLRAGGEAVPNEHLAHTSPSDGSISVCRTISFGIVPRRPPPGAGRSTLAAGVV